MMPRCRPATGTSLEAVQAGPARGPHHLAARQLQCYDREVDGGGLRPGTGAHRPPPPTSSFCPRLGKPMASPDLLDFDRLLQPFAGDPPTGRDPRRDTAPYPAYQELRDQRSKARRAERDAEAFDGDEVLAADASSSWSTVIDRCKTILTSQGKDLEVAGHLTEALVRKHGFAGLRDGLKLIRLTIEAFWEDLYPRAEEESEDRLQARIKPLADLNGEDADGTLIEPLRKVPLTAGDDPGPFALWQYQNATEVRRDPGLLDQIKASARATPVPLYRDLIEDLDAAVAEWTALAERMSGLCGEAAPPTSRVRNVLDEVRTALRYLTEDLPPVRALFARDAGTADSPGAAADDGAAGGEASAAAPGVPVAVPAGAIRNREDALATLLRVAEFFRQTEPHSPVSYSLEDLVRRARLPFPELLKELVPDDGARRDLLTRAGIVPPPAEGDGY